MSDLQVQGSHFLFEAWVGSVVIGAYTECHILQVHLLFFDVEALGDSMMGTISAAGHNHGAARFRDNPVMMVSTRRSECLLMCDIDLVFMQLTYEYGGQLTVSGRTQSTQGLVMTQLKNRLLGTICSNNEG